MEQSKNLEEYLLAPFPYKIVSPNDTGLIIFSYGSFSSYANARSAKIDYERTNPGVKFYIQYPVGYTQNGKEY